MGCGIVAGLTLLSCVGGIGLLYTMWSGAKPLVAGPLANGTEIVSDGISAIYVVPAGNDEVVLVDAGMDREASAVKAALVKPDGGSQRVSAILLTHGHGDHIGALHQFPDADVWVGSADWDLVTGERAADSDWGELRGAEPTGLQPTHRLEGGEVLEIGELQVEVFAIPGHTHGSMAYLIDGVLFLGDSAGATSTDEIAPAPAFFSADVERNEASLRQLAATLAPRADDVQTMAFGHQGPLDGLDALIEWSR